MTTTFKQAVLWVAALNLIYFFIEGAVALSISSVSLMADAIDFLEDAFVNGLIVLALAWSLRQQAQVAKLLALIILVPSAITLFIAIQQVMNPQVPQAFSLTLTGAGALLVNLFCAYLLYRYKNGQNALTLAAFYSARNDAIANLGIIGAGLLTMVWVSHWPDLIVGMIIFYMNLDAAKAVYTAAKREESMEQP